ncbi:MAG: NAD(P)/FAD-dependent oxidoreductase [Gammaproteobacteria bacterium]|uniref:NAD(P)/FAD-dependent oxidoreductase n=1 Tax=Rhodoferax sp. TaxID=50421 RepID=UPI0018483C55|nr:NAD(P)/FAD-dependent oxidoreductase [Rhodoferax sp.]MBU3900067.1 NAD(P)/FAD-dependent oxidoreductase [Gammaproteobacteria bacterium]MBA3059742.1 NAD(P)/FAD-dependent oxidoreductase [Rhodoferax sp.]MBU3999431.1 NAD(P)/FAD-dependent oxidoreductase [Gammaproteobacteria bacterium]MBU4082105.1 NAD(P)/FAD-dependent oxidoreductase [Gammaproteobacteria bacterium]MBU4113900.1 NAD(P)/FAD-dependent oxidoreductase [Gammaproteobacteria bacterium]
MQKFDVVVVGAGAAGLFCAGVAGQLGLKVLVLDHSDKVAEKIRISGGGRCNFTNIDTSATNFLGNNPKFCRSALSNYPPRRFTELLQRRGIAFHEKHKGQLFCDRSSEDIIALLLAECDAGGVTRWQPCSVKNVVFSGSSPDESSVSSYEIESDRGSIRCAAVVIATGGLSIPKIGATDFGYHIARQFGLRLALPRPALVPLTFDGDAWAPYAALAGLSLPVQIETGSKKEKFSFLEDLLFTHRGLSGPAVLQISSYWQPGTAIRINLAPAVELLPALKRAKLSSRKLIVNELAQLVPARLAEVWVQDGASAGHDWQRPISEASDKALAVLAERLMRWELTPTGTEGYKKAEVTAGGVDTRELSSQTMESRQAGLYFIGEVVDVTGWLGGYNFQWAWASAFACAQALAAKLAKP